MAMATFALASDHRSSTGRPRAQCSALVHLENRGTAPSGTEATSARAIPLSSSASCTGPTVDALVGSRVLSPGALRSGVATCGSDVVASEYCHNSKVSARLLYSAQPC